MVYVYIMVMALVTYLIRMLPLTIFKKKITNKYIKSFLYYIPYACLMAMTFPSVFYATGGAFSVAVAIGVCVAILLSLWGKGLVTVSVCACVVVYVLQNFCGL